MCCGGLLEGIEKHLLLFTKKILYILIHESISHVWRLVGTRKFTLFSLNFLVLACKTLNICHIDKHFFEDFWTYLFLAMAR